MEITLKDIKIKVEAEKEYTPFEVEYRHMPSCIKSIAAAVKKSKTWGWCCVKVTVSLKKVPDVVGEAYLGFCSYESKQDFINNSNYYEQLVEEATQDLAEMLNFKFKSHADDLLKYNKIDYRLNTVAQVLDSIRFTSGVSFATK